MDTPVLLLDQVVCAVRVAGEGLRNEFHQARRSQRQRYYAAIDQEIEGFLRERLPFAAIYDWLGEETPPKITGAKRVWVVDPHDGTSAFLSGFRGSSVSVALVEHGIPVLGVVVSPLAPNDTGDLFTWAKGTSAKRNGVPLAHLEDSVPFDAKTIIALNEHAGSYASANHRAYSPARTLAMPSIAYRLALAAAGEVSLGMSLMDGLSPYDVAAGHALLIGVGGDVRQLDGAPIRYDLGVGLKGCVGGAKSLLADAVTRRPRGRSRCLHRRTQHRLHTRSPDRLARAHGAVLGQLIGDALGSQVEFMSEREIARRCPNGVSEMLPSAVWGTLAGQPTDDSEMALALARSIAELGEFDAGAVAQAYIDWRNSDPFDIGYTTSRAIDALEGEGPPAMESKSNGALMRVSPVGIFAAGDPRMAMEIARHDAHLTHPNPLCVAASGAYAAAISVGVAGGDAQDMVAAASESAGTDAAGDEIRSEIKEAQQTGPADFQQHMGYVLIAFRNAFHLLQRNQSVADALVYTIGKGGDTDTNAAICGALLGSLQGRSAFPTKWQLSVLTCRPVAVKGVKHPRPAGYWPDDALQLAERLLHARTHARNHPQKNKGKTEMP